ncbi:MAG: right-handed parallel beta-helix repeat-containing protein [Planctomycetota bacterium]
MFAPILYVLSFGAAAPGSIPAETIYVDAANPNCPGNGTAEDPYCSIQDAVTAARDGDSILVAPGEYQDVQLGDKSLALRATGSSDQTIIRARSGRAGIESFGGSATIEGFEIRDGFPGVRFQGDSLVLRGNTIRGATGLLGAAATVTANEVVLSRNEITGNSSGAPVSLIEIDGGEYVQVENNRIHENAPNQLEAVVRIRNVVELLLRDNEIIDNETLYPEFFQPTAVQIDWVEQSTIQGNFLGSRSRPVSGSGIHVLGFTDTTVRDNEIRRFDSRREGAAIYAWLQGSPSSRVLLEDNTISGNRSSRDGGAVWLRGPDLRIEDNHFSDNRSLESGGALFVHGQRVLVRGNHIERNEAFQTGGALHATGVTTEVLDNRFRRNAAKQFDGGAMFLGGSGSVSVVGNEIVQNRAGRYGSALRSVVGALLLHNTIADNVAERGAAVWLAQTGQSSTIADCILWGNRPAALGGPGLATSIVEFSDIEGSFPGQGNIVSDPVFRDPARLDYRLDCKSPCVDRASTRFRAERPGFDLGGLDPRQIGPPDMGADEVGLSIKLTAPLRRGGTPTGFELRHPPVGAPLTGLVLVSLGDGGQPVPGSAGRRIGLEADALLKTWLALDPSIRTADLRGCEGATTAPFVVPVTAPVGLTVYFAGLSIDDQLRVLSISGTEQARIE